MPVVAPRKITAATDLDSDQVALIQDHRLPKACAGSAANHALHAIRDAGRELEGLLSEYLDKHPEGCHCVFCAAHQADEVNFLRTDLQGFLWCVQNGLGWVEGLLITRHSPAQ